MGDAKPGRGAVKENTHVLVGKAKKAITLPEDHERLLVRSVGMLIIAGDEQDVRAEVELVTYFSQAIFAAKFAFFAASKRFFHQILVILVFFLQLHGKRFFAVGLIEAYGAPYDSGIPFCVMVTLVGWADALNLIFPKF